MYILQVTSIHPVTCMPSPLRKSTVRPARNGGVTPSTVPSHTPQRPVDTKKSKTYRLSEGKIAAAQAILGAPTATAAIESALDMVVFRRELVDGTSAMLGVAIGDYDSE